MDFFFAKKLDIFFHLLFKGGMTEENIKKHVHSLGVGKSGCIHFIHTDGKEHSFTSTINRLSGSRLSYFDDEGPSVDDSDEWVKSVFRDIRKKTKVVKCMSDF